MKNTPVQLSALLKTQARHLLDWVDVRTGARGILRHILDERIPGGARVAYVFGSGLLCIFVLQIVTGISLALYYTPTAETAHTTVAYITKQVAGGAFLRSLHSYGSSAMIIVLVLHFLQTFFYGSFKGRRELLWISGALLSFLVLAMGFTGYLLPWDQKSYFATAVGTNVAGQVPIIGGFITRFLRGGSTIGTLTISRFYVAHVFLIPATIFLFVAAHIFLFRKAGAAGPVHEHAIDPKLHSEPFYPRQVLYDMGAALLVVGILAALSYLRPVTLGPIANPSDSTFLPRPEWYYLPMFEWLKFWEGPTVVIGIVVIPGILATAFFLMPFLDRNLERRPWRRPIPALAVSLIVLAMVYLGVRSRLEDGRGAAAAQLAHQQAEELAYNAAPFQPYSVDRLDGALVRASASGPADPRVSRGKAMFLEHGCVGCHGAKGTGSAIAPALVGVTRKLSQQQITTLLHHPNPRMKAAGMPTLDTAPPDTDALIAYLGALGTPAASVAPQFNPAEELAPTPTTRQPRAPVQLISASQDSRLSESHTTSTGNPAEAGRRIFQERGCFACHGKEGAGGRAPALAPMVALLNEAELGEVLRNPNGAMRKAGMEGVPDATPGELASLIAYLRSLPLAGTHSEKAAKVTAPVYPHAASLPASPDRVLVASVGAPTANPPDPPPSQGSALAAPSASAPTPIEAGRAVFKAQGCTGCHGFYAKGTEKAPSLYGVSIRHPGGDLPALLRKPNPKMRAGGMPIPQVNDAELSDLVAYLSSLPAPLPQEGAAALARTAAPGPSAAHRADTRPAMEETAAAHTPADPLVTRGQVIFRKSSCGACHGQDGIFGTVAAPGLAGFASVLPAPALEHILRHHTPRMKQGGMPVTNFNDQDLASIVAYIRSLPSDTAKLDNRFRGPTP